MHLMFTCCFNCNTSHVVKTHTIQTKKKKVFTTTASFYSNSKQVCSVHKNAFTESFHHSHFRSHWHHICFTRFRFLTVLFLYVSHMILNMELLRISENCFHNFDTLHILVSKKKIFRLCLNLIKFFLFYCCWPNLMQQENQQWFS